MTDSYSSRRFRPISRFMGLSRPTVLLAGLLLAAGLVAVPWSTPEAGANVECRIEAPSAEFADEVGQSAAAAQVWRLYQSIYLRQPQRSGFDYWVSVRESGATMATIAKSFMADSQEFTNRYGDVNNQQFVRLVFNNVLCRDPADTGLDYWSGQLRAGGSRTDLLLNFTELHEYMRTTGTCFSATGVSQDELDHCEAGYQDRLFEQQVIDLTNEARAAGGCGPLSNDPLLHKAALAHSVDMSENEYFDHFSLDGSNPGDRIARAGYDFRGWAENIAWGYPTAEAVVNGWMNSPGHRSNILNCGFTEVGIGFYDRFWTQNFGIPR